MIQLNPPIPIIKKEKAMKKSNPHMNKAEKHMKHAEHHHKMAKEHMEHAKKHTDMKEDKMLVKKMVKKNCMK